MNSLPELLGAINDFITWATEKNVERDLGLPIGSSLKLVNLSRQNTGSLEQVKNSLTQLYVKWNEIAQVNASSFGNSLGGQLLQQLRTTDQVLNQTIKDMTSFNTELAIYQGLLQRTTADNETRYERAKVDLANVQATIADYKNKLADAKRRGDRQAIASFSVGVIITDVQEKNAVAHQKYINERLVNGAKLVANLAKIETLLVGTRNLANSIDTDLEDAVRQEGKALQTTSESLAAYYQRQVGRELTQLFALV